MAPWVPWLAFGIGFAPAVLSVGRGFFPGEVPIDRAPLVGAALLAGSLAALREQRTGGHRDGAALLLLACGLELVGIASGSWSIAHLSIPLGFLGLARLLGTPPARTAALAFFAVPLPHFS